MHVDLRVPEGVRRDLDQVGTVFSIIGYSVPTFFTGLLMIIIFSVRLGWFPSYYDTTLEVTDCDGNMVKNTAQVGIITEYPTGDASP